MQKKAYLLLEDGLLIEGKAIGKIGTSGGEICFNTGMTGYQEIYTDPSYVGQIIVNTTAHIGNYGATDEEQESAKPTIAGIVVNEFAQEFSRKSATESLATIPGKKWCRWNSRCGYANAGAPYPEQGCNECDHFFRAYA